MVIFYWFVTRPILTVLLHFIYKHSCRCSCCECDGLLRGQSWVVAGRLRHGAGEHLLTVLYGLQTAFYVYLCVFMCTLKVVIISWCFKFDY